MSTFTVAGVSNNKGNVKVRFCSDIVLRIKNLQKQGDTDIVLVELPNPMTKIQACQYLLEQEAFKDYKTDIEEVMGKKKSKVDNSKVGVKIEIAETDPEIEAIKQLAA